MSTKNIKHQKFTLVPHQIYNGPLLPHISSGANFVPFASPNSGVARTIIGEAHIHIFVFCFINFF
jgi:hypothetical protein